MIFYNHRPGMVHMQYVLQNQDSNVLQNDELGFLQRELNVWINGRQFSTDNGHGSIEDDRKQDDRSDFQDKDRKDESHGCTDLKEDSIYDDNSCLLGRLLNAIDCSYKDYPHLFEKLTNQNVRDIQISLLEGTYTLSPLRVVPKIGELNPFVNHTTKVTFMDGNTLLMSISPTLEDSLVLTGIGFLLMRHFNNLKILKANSLGFNMNLNDYYSYKVCSRGDVFCLYKFDLTNSRNTLNRESLLCKLSHIVNDGGIMELLGQFLSLPILDEFGCDYTDMMGFSIPPSGFISEVLYNFALIEIDDEFHRFFPGLTYYRYIYEVFVSIPNKCTYSSKQGRILFEQRVLGLFEKLNLCCNIVSIEPGEEPVPCYGGILHVSPDGNIEFEEM